MTRKRTTKHTPGPLTSSDIVLLLDCIDAEVRRLADVESREPNRKMRSYAKDIARDLADVRIKLLRIAPSI